MKNTKSIDKKELMELHLNDLSDIAGGKRLTPEDIRWIDDNLYMLKHTGFTKEEQLNVMRRFGYGEYEDFDLLIKYCYDQLGVEQEFDPNTYYDLFDWD